MQPHKETSSLAAAARVRPCGRIAGFAPAHAAAALPAIPHSPAGDTRDQTLWTVWQSALGDQFQFLGDEASVVADHDTCSLAGRPLLTPEDWLPAVQANRLGEIEGAAFVLAWRGSDGSVLLARDPVGERTLYYSETAAGLLFASSIRALLATGLVPWQIDPVSVATYLSYAYLPGRGTMLQNVFELLPGEWLRYHNGQMTRGSYWRLPSEPRKWEGELELRSQLRSTLEAAVRRRVAGEQAIGASLSGGLDSSLVVALAQQLHPAPLHTYSISFGAEYRNELEFSSLVARHCGTRHHILEFSPTSIVDSLDDTMAQLSDPIGDPLTVPNSLLFSAAAADVSVVLNGEGGDPCFGGPKNLPMLLAELYSGVTAGYQRERSYLRAHLKCYDDLTRMLTPQGVDTLRSEPLERWLAERFGDPRWQGFVTRLQAINIEFKAGHHILPKVDALSFPHGLLPRAPLFDRAVVEFSFRIPGQLKLHGSIEKYLLKRAVEDLLPNAILERPKSGMLVPVEGWFRGPLAAAARTRLLDRYPLTDWVRRDYLEKLLAGKLGGLRPRHGAKIWLLLTLESWLQGHEPRAERS
ncbi:MAG: asparagine synthetase B family protein [Planctomycetota bacterium]